VALWYLIGKKSTELLKRRLKEIKNILCLPKKSKAVV